MRFSEQASIVFYIALMLWAVVLAQLAQSLALRSREGTYFRARPGGVVFAIGFAAACMPFALALSFRYATGSDTLTYFSRFEQFAGIRSLAELLQQSGEMEIGYVALNAVIGLVGGNANTQFFAAAALTFASLVLGLWGYRDAIPMGLAMYIGFAQIIPHSFNIMRQMVAVFFVWCAIRAALDKRLAAFMVWIALATSFHISALVVLPFYFAAGEKRRNRIVSGCLLGIALVFFVGYAYFYERLSFLPDLSVYLYQNSGVEYKNLILRIPVLLLFLFYGRIVRRAPQYRFLYLLLLVELVFALLSSMNTNLYRMALYFRLSWMVLFPAAVRSMPTQKWYMAACVFVLLFFAVLFYRDFIQFNNGEWIPYEWRLAL